MSAFYCPNCNLALGYDPCDGLWKCFPCHFVTDIPEDFSRGQGVGRSVREDADCRCGHSWYDHIGFRDHLEGEARLRTSCRIAYCSCLESCGGYRP